ncbi:unnamed protein product, partial [Mesorhabditis spiculigera]
MIYDFEFIDDTYMMPVEEDGKTVLKALDQCGNGPYDESGRVRPEAVPYNKNHDRIYYEHPLKMMADSERMSLLSHKLVKELLKLKWNNLGKYVYYSASFVYLVFLLCFTTFLAMIPAPFNVRYGNGTMMDLMDDGNATCSSAQDFHNAYINLFKTIVMCLAGAQIVKEIYQFYTRRWAYLSLENLLEIFIYTAAIMTMYDFSPCSEHSAIRLNWQWMLATLGTFLAWINLLLLIRKLPRFGIFVLMFVDVFKTFTRFALIFFLFITAFSITFFLMMQNRPEFSTIPMSIVKTLVMTIGEMEYNGIFHGTVDVHEESLFSKAIAFPVFFLFCVLMTILLMNLLVGLAVDDIKSVQEKAELKRLSMQVDLVLQVERSMSFWRKKFTRSRLSFYPNRITKWKRFRRLFGANQLDDYSDVYDQQAAEEESSGLKRELGMQRELINHLQTNVDYLYEKQVKFQDMLESIMEKLETISSDSRQMLANSSSAEAAQKLEKSNSAEAVPPASRDATHLLTTDQDFKMPDED